MALREERRDRQLSIVIPTRNRATLLDGAITSVLESPLVTSPQQIIVVDDDSYDPTGDVARRRGVHYLRVSEHNISRVRNAGLDRTQSTYIAFLDDDDLWLPGNMEPQLAALEAHPTAAFAFGRARAVWEDLEPLPETFRSPPLPSGLVPEQLHLTYPNLGVVLFRRQVVVDVGGFDSRIAYHQDADLLLRIAAHHEIIGIEFVGMLHRIRSPSRARSDYYWARREVTRWSPKHQGVGRRAAATFKFRTRALFFFRFCADAAASIELGDPEDVVVSLGRAVWIAPLQAVRYFPMLASLVWQCMRRGRSSPRRALDSSVPTGSAQAS